MNSLHNRKYHQQPTLIAPSTAATNHFHRSNRISSNHLVPTTLTSSTPFPHYLWLKQLEKKKKKYDR